MACANISRMKNIISALRTAYWDSYRESNGGNGSDQKEQAIDITYFRNRIFHLLSLYLIPIGLIALVPGVLVAVKSGTSLGYVVAGCDLLIACILIYVILSKKIKIGLKKATIIGMLYFLSVFLLISLGSFGPGVIFIALVSVLMTLIFNNKIGKLSIWINLTICLFLGIIIELELFDSLLIKQYTLYDWVAYSSNLMVFSVVSYLLINNLIRGLEVKINELDVTKARQYGLLASQTNYVVRTDMSGVYRYVNDAFLRDFGWLYDDNVILGHNSLSSILHYHHQLVTDIVTKCVEEKTKIFQVSLDKPKIDGSVRSTLWDFVCIMDETGMPSEIQCIGIDISERVKAQEQLELSLEDLYKHNKELQTYAYVISHNLRAPIANIAGLVSLIEIECGDEKAMTEYVTALKDSTLSLDQVVKDLSKGVSIGGLGVESFAEDVNLYDVLSSIRADLKGLIASTETELVFPGDYFPLRSYKPYLYIIFYNLICNAIKFKSEQRPLIRITITLEAQFVAISVTDNGIGIDLVKHYDDLFKPYKRVINTIPGKGLGLFFVKRHVDALKGIILVESELGIGSTFKVLLPTFN